MSEVEMVARWMIQVAGTTDCIVRLEPRRRAAACRHRNFSIGNSSLAHCSVVEPCGTTAERMPEIAQGAVHSVKTSLVSRSLAA
jgi:hypothetical protein